MFTGILHTHFTVVILFLLLYLVKTFLLLTNKTTQLDLVRKKTIAFEIVISVIFLLTGLYLAFQLPTSEINIVLITKLCLVFASIPIAVIGFKKHKKVFAAISFIMILGAFALGEIHKKQMGKVEKPIVVKEGQSNTGADLFEANCVKCHGADGKLGLVGAKDLSISTLTSTETKEIVKNGKGSMPKYNALTDAELDAIVEHIATLKK